MMSWVKLSFRHSDEGTGTDVVLLVAVILLKSKSEGDFSASSNATSLEFMTGGQRQQLQK